MTAIDRVRPQPSEAYPRPPIRQRSRLIAVGVRDAEHDAATIDWTASEATVDVDTVHIVHAYASIRLPGCVWEPVMRARDARQLAGRHRAALAVQRAQHKYPDVPIGVSVIAGEPADVLEQMSEVVDLVVLGDDSAAPGSAGKIAWRVQDVARCPVVCVPPGHKAAPDLPVTLVADDRGLPEPAVEFAAAAASRHGVTLQVSRAWASLHRSGGPQPLVIADQQQILDAQLADLAERYPHLGVIGRIELADDWLLELCGQSSLVVAGTRSAASVRSVAHEPLPCPTAIVPDWD